MTAEKPAASVGSGIYYGNDLADWEENFRTVIAPSGRGRCGT